MKPISGSKNLTINYLELILLRDRDEASQARAMPTIRTYLWPRYVSRYKNYSVVLLNSCELYLAL